MNVLFIEDDPMNRRVVKDLLDVAGATMTGAEDGATGLQMLDAQDFQIVLVDLRMPGMDGITAIQHIRARADAKARVPIIVVTAMAETADRVRGLLLGADDYLIKPVDMEDLRAKVQQTLKRFENIAKPREEFST